MWRYRVCSFNQWYHRQSGGVAGCHSITGETAHDQLVHTRYHSIRSAICSEDRLMSKLHLDFSLSYDISTIQNIRFEFILKAVKWSV
jgi:hypothetical protein